MTEAAAEQKKVEGHSVIEGARQEMRAALEDLKSIRCRLLGVVGSIPPSARETSRGDLEGDPDVETELRTVAANGVRNCLDPLIDDLGTAIDYQPDPVAAGSMSIAHLDLSVFSEETRQALYEVVAAENFGHTETATGKGSVLPYNAEQAGLEVVWAWGRWFASWWKLELPETFPEAQRREILQLQESRQRPGTLAYGEV